MCITILNVYGKDDILAEDQLAAASLMHLKDTYSAKWCCMRFGARLGMCTDSELSGMRMLAEHVLMVTWQTGLTSQMP